MVPSQLQNCTLWSAQARLGKHIEECLWLLDETFTKYSVNFFIFEPLSKKTVAVVQFCALFKLGHSLNKEFRVQWQLQAEGMQVYIPHYHIKKNHQSTDEELEMPAPSYGMEVLSWEGTCRIQLSTSVFRPFFKMKFLKSPGGKEKMSVFLISAQHKRHWAAESCSRVHHLHLN